MVQQNPSFFRWGGGSGSKGKWVCCRLLQHDIEHAGIDQRETFGGEIAEREIDRERERQGNDLEREKKEKGKNPTRVPGEVRTKRG